MSKARRERLQKRRFQDFHEVCTIFREWFDIEVAAGMDETERVFVARMFHRRHVYEHNGGEVDQKYIDDSGDTSVRPKQMIRESQEDAHRLLGSLVKMGRNLHRGFHELIPPIQDPIREHQAERERLANLRGKQPS